MKYCIVDDEPIAHRIIEGYCENLPHLHKVGNCYDVFEAMELLKKQDIDLVFLDINMPKLSGFDLLKSVQPFPKVIVTTAHQEFALEGYELNIIDYLLKPFSLERFLKAINKVMELQTPATKPAQDDKPVGLFLKGDKKTYHIYPDQILFVEAYGNYTKLFLKEEMILIHEKISAMEELLPGTGFKRVHKSFIIAINKMNTIEGNRIKMSEHTVPIGQTYRQNVVKLLRGK